jgi:tetratricopeptide (TPR) repeat protein
MEKPDYAEAHLGMARALVAQGTISAAIECLDKAIEAQPDFSPAYYQLGNLLLLQGKTNVVMNRFSAILESQPEIAEAHYFIGVGLRLQGEMRGALEHWRKAAELKPNWIEVLNNLAWHLATQPDLTLRSGDEALELAKRAVELTGRKDPETLDTLAAAYAELGRHREAAETVREAIALAEASGQANLLTAMQEQLARYLGAGGKP